MLVIAFSCSINFLVLIQNVIQEIKERYFANLSQAYYFDTALYIELVGMNTRAFPE